MKMELNRLQGDIEAGSATPEEQSSMKMELIRLQGDAEAALTTRLVVAEQKLDKLYNYLTKEYVSIQYVQDFIHKNPNVLNEISLKHDGKNILQIACSNLAKKLVKNGNEDVLKVLVDKENLFYSNKLDNCMEAIHYAARSCQVNILRILIDKIKEVNASGINATTSDGDTALMMILKTKPHKSLKCVELLLNSGIDVNVSDINNTTAILLACKKLDNYIDQKNRNTNTEQGQKDMIKIIQLLIRKDCNLDFCRLKNKTARMWIQKHSQILSEIDLPVEKVLDESTNEFIFGLLKEGREKDFLNHINRNYNVNFGDNTINLLQLACFKGCEKCVQKLLQLKANTGIKTRKNDYPLEIAGRRGHVDIFKAVLCKTHVDTSFTLLGIIKNSYKHEDYKINYEKCLDILLQHKPARFDVNYQDEDGLTPLHCSTKLRKPSFSLKLLIAGALLSEKNKDGDMPVNDIDISTLEKYFDYCIHYRNQRIFNNPRPTEEAKKGLKQIQVNYTTLLPKSDEKSCVSHMEIIDAISKKSELKSVLKHPYISSFLFLKWHRLRWVHYLNLLIYAIFCLLLCFYIFFIYLKEDQNSIVLFALLFVITTALVLREALQFISRPKHYLHNFENWMELALFSITYVIIIKQPSEKPDRKILAAIAIIFAAFEVVLSLGQIYLFSTYVKMLRQISLNFLKFILWQVVLLLGFAFSFYILFSRAADTTTTDKSANANQTTKEEKEEGGDLDMFQDLSLSIARTMAMLNGEYDASSIKFKLYPIMSVIIFLTFVFMISMVAFNLLNGLAISDIQEIKEEAEIVANISKLNYMQMLESLYEKFKDRLPSKALRKYFFKLVYLNPKFIKDGKALINEEGVFVEQDEKTERKHSDENLENSGITSSTNETINKTGRFRTIMKWFFKAQLHSEIFDKMKRLVDVIKIEEKFSSEQMIIKQQNELENVFREMMKEQKKMQNSIEKIQQVVKVENAVQEVIEEQKNIRSNVEQIYEMMTLQSNTDKIDELMKKQDKIENNIEKLLNIVESKQSVGDN